MTKLPSRRGESNDCCVTTESRLEVPRAAHLPSLHGSGIQAGLSCVVLLPRAVPAEVFHGLVFSCWCRWDTKAPSPSQGSLDMWLLSLKV